MTFTKTSQKFGQWSDARANTVYGLGFASESDLNNVSEPFQDEDKIVNNLGYCAFYVASKVLSEFWCQFVCV